jgi:hypothetical protein
MDKTRRRRVALRAQEESAMVEGQREFHLAQQAAVLRMASKGADPAYNGNVRRFYPTSLQTIKLN